MPRHLNSNAASTFDLQATLLRATSATLADVQFADGTEATVHCPQPGAMLGLAEPGTRILLSRSDNPARKLAHTWEFDDLATRACRHQHAAAERAGARGARRARDPGARHLHQLSPRGENTGRPAASTSCSPPRTRHRSTSKSRTCTSRASSASPSFPIASPHAAPGTWTNLGRHRSRKAHAPLSLFVVQRTDCEAFGARA